jgi:thiol-disulfide isomerase/thioredoxin
MTKRRAILMVAATWLALPGTTGAQLVGEYRAVLETPGGELPFILLLEKGPGGLRGRVMNGGEKIEIPLVRLEGNRVVMEFTHYDSLIEAERLGRDKGRRLRGRWTKRSGAATTVSLPFSAEPYSGHRFSPHLQVTSEVLTHPPIGGRWAVKFSGDEDGAVGIFQPGEGHMLEGTVLTTTGDYRYLAGSYEHGLLRLSCFDGTHAFLLSARVESDGSLRGDFWSGAKWHQAWTAKRDEKASLPDGFGLTRIRSPGRVRGLTFRDLEGRERALGDGGLMGKATIIEVFGSWCPNCHDAAKLLVELERTYGPRGLRVVGLAFEATDDPRQVRRYAERHGVTYPMLMGGRADKREASTALPVIDRVRAFPTFLFVDGEGVVRSVYTGFTGPAGGAEHERLRGQFRRVIEELLAGR